MITSCCLPVIDVLWHAGSALQGQTPTHCFIRYEELHCDRKGLCVTSSNLRHDACQDGGTIWAGSSCIL